MAPSASGAATPSYCTMPPCASTSITPGSRSTDTWSAVTAADICDAARASACGLVSVMSPLALRTSATAPLLMSPIVSFIHCTSPAPTAYSATGGVAADSSALVAPITAVLLKPVIFESSSENVHRNFLRYSTWALRTSSGHCFLLTLFRAEAPSNPPASSPTPSSPGVVITDPSSPAKSSSSSDGRWNATLLFACSIPVLSRPVRLLARLP
mmetsp:Transcript_4341/g.15005  ORF Transcript_4341/g.15005 Transcript_4341/m.15005 type:complete len:212 (+) Transcript_4341:813-1448(+)